MSLVSNVLLHFVQHDIACDAFLIDAGMTSAVMHLSRALLPNRTDTSAKEPYCDAKCNTVLIINVIRKEVCSVLCRK